jgi:hypothetical protein
MILRSSHSHSLFTPYHHNHHLLQRQQQQQQTQQTRAQHHPSVTSPSMPSSRPLRNKYSSQALTPSPLRRKSFVPPDSDGDGDSDLDTRPMEPEDMFGRSSTFTARTLRVHPRRGSQASQSSLNKGQSIVPSAPVEDDEGLFLSTCSSPSRLKPKVTARPSNPRVKRAFMSPPLPPSALTNPSSPTRTTTIHTLATSTPAMTTSVPCNTSALSGTVGVKRKPTPLPITAPYPKRGMTPLCVTKAAGAGSFDRLAPLPAPKF